MEDQLLLLIVLVGTAGVAAQWIGWRLGLPAIVILLIVGFLLGPFLRILDPERDFGAFLNPAISLAVAIVILQESLGLDFSGLRAGGRAVARIVGLGVPMIWAFGAVAAHFLAGLSWPIAAVIGVMLVITGPTVISPLLRQAKLERRAATVLRWEGIVNDPVGAVLTVIVLELLLLWGAAREIEAPLRDVAIDLASGTLAAATLGIGAGFFVRFMFARGYVPEFLKSPLVLAVALLIYALSHLVQHEAGLIAVAVLGVALANLGLPEIEDLKQFKESLSTFLVSGVFIVLAATVDVGAFLRLDWGAFAFIAAMMFLVRPLAVGLATIGTELTWQERLFVGLVAPRGIVVASLAGLVHQQLANSGYEGADLIAPLVFSVIIATVLVHGLGLGPLSRALGLASERPPGLLIVGAGDWTIGLTKVLTRLGTPIVLSDPSTAALEPARGLAATTHTGHLLAPEEEDAGLLTETEYLLAATEDDAFNALLCRKFATDLGQQNVYQVAYAGRGEAAPRFHREWRGNIVIDGEMPLAELNRRVAEGWRFRAVPVRGEEARDGLRPSPRAVRAADTAWGEEARDGLRPSPGSRLPVAFVQENGELLFASPETELHVGGRGTLVVFEAPEHRPAAAGERPGDR